MDLGVFLSKREPRKKKKGEKEGAFRSSWDAVKDGKTIGRTDGETIVPFAAFRKDKASAGLVDPTLSRRYLAPAASHPTRSFGLAQVMRLGRAAAGDKGIAVQLKFGDE